MSEKSREAFFKIIESGKLESDKAIIYSLIKKEPQTIETLKAHLKKDKSSFSSRLNDLLDLGVIDERDGGRYTLYVPVLDPFKQEELSSDRFLHKCFKWLNIGINKGYIKYAECYINGQKNKD